MDVEEEETRRSKRKGWVCEESKPSDFFLDFFPHFTVPPDVWGNVEMVDDIENDRKALFYLHRSTNRPLMVKSHYAPNSKKVIAYEIAVRMKEDGGRPFGIRLAISDDEADEDKCGKVIYTLAQIDEQYDLEGPILDREEAVKYYDEFLDLLFVKSQTTGWLLNDAIDPQPVVRSVKARKGRGKK